MTYTDRQLYGWMHMHPEGKAFIQKLESRKEGLARDMDRADDCQLRKIAGGIVAITDILDEIEENRPGEDGETRP